MISNDIIWNWILFVTDFTSIIRQYMIQTTDNPNSSAITDATVSHQYDDWVPSWKDPNESTFDDFVNDNNVSIENTDYNSKIDLSIACLMDTRRLETSLSDKSSISSREVAYAVSLSYMTFEHVTIPNHVDYNELHQRSTSSSIRHVLQTVQKFGLCNTLSQCSVHYYRITNNHINAIFNVLANACPIVFGFVLLESFFENQNRGLSTFVICETEETTDRVRTLGSMVGTIVGFVDGKFKIHVSDHRLFTTSGLPYIYATMSFIESKLCDDFFIVQVKHNEPEFIVMN